MNAGEATTGTAAGATTAGGATPARGTGGGVAWVVGVVSVASHIVGNELAAMIAAFGQGDVEAAAAINASLFPIFDLCFKDPNPTPVKGALSALWEPVGSPRLPLVDAKPETVAALVAAVRALA